MNFTPVHLRENNAASQANLDKNRPKFTGDCWNVLQALLQGERLTTRGAILIGLSGHLPRRIKDIEEGKIAGINVVISREKIDNNGTLAYYMTMPEIIRVKNAIIKTLEVK